MCDLGREALCQRVYKSTCLHLRVCVPDMLMGTLGCDLEREVLSKRVYTSTFLYHFVGVLKTRSDTWGCDCVMNVDANPGC